MDNLLTAKEIKEHLSLVDMLARLGFHPAKRSGKELFYLSMLRDSDRTPSFFVNEQMDVWYDQGLSKGGNIIDFGLAFWPGLDFKDVLVKIQETCEGSVIVSPFERERKRRKHALKLPHYKVEEIKELGNNPAIKEYLQQRGVWDIARGRLKEIYYYVEDEKKFRKHFFAAGWQNELGAWEVRNKYFKGCMGHKAMTLVPGAPEHIVIFEGFINYLSWLTENPDAKAAALILNSLSFLQQAIKKAKEFDNVELYFDRDKAGHEASALFTKETPIAVDRSNVYSQYNDYNDYLVAAMKAGGPLRKDLFRAAFIR